MAIGTLGLLNVIAIFDAMVVASAVRAACALFALVGLLCRIAYALGKRLIRGSVGRLAVFVATYEALSIFLVALADELRHCEVFLLRVPEELSRELVPSRR